MQKNSFYMFYTDFCIFQGRLNNDVRFAEEHLKREGTYLSHADKFASGILLYADLTQFLSNEELLLITEKSCLKQFKEIELLISSNNDLACRLTKDCSFLKNFSELTKCSYLDIIQHPAVMKVITADAAYQ